MSELDRQLYLPSAPDKAVRTSLKEMVHALATRPLPSGLQETIPLIKHEHFAPH